MDVGHYRLQTCSPPARDRPTARTKRSPLLPARWRTSRHGYLNAVAAHNRREERPGLNVREFPLGVLSIYTCARSHSFAARSTRGGHGCQLAVVRSIHAAHGAACLLSRAPVAAAAENLFEARTLPRARVAAAQSCTLAHDSVGERRRADRPST